MSYNIIKRIKNILPPTTKPTGEYMKKCNIENCNRLEHSRGWCGTHYQSFRVQGKINNFRPKPHHGLSKTAEYKTWCGMKARCYIKNEQGYVNYGGRGIKVCDRWLESFLNFYNDMGKKPTSKHSIDRIDNDGNYTPDNCRWATRTEQNLNQRIRKDNKSGYRGIYYRKAIEGYEIYGRGVKRKYIGSAKTITDAVKMRDAYESVLV